MKCCEVCGITEESTRIIGKMCRRHYLQLYRHGSVLSRTIYDPNRFIVEGNICRIELYNAAGAIAGYALIDAEDVEKTKGIKWYLKQGYVRGSLPEGEKVFLHRLLMDCPDGLYVDHKYGDPLDNRKAMLRICTHSQNLKNMSKKKNKGIKKVQSGKFQAVITVDYKAIYLGTFDTLELARNARRKAELKYYGEFA